MGQLKQPTDAIVDILNFPRHNGKQFLQEAVYVAFVASKGDAKPKILVMNNGNELNSKYYKNYRNSIQSKKADKYSYDQYWAGIDQATVGKKRLYVSLDGIYNQIALNTLQKPNAGKYVVEEKTLVFLTNTKDLLEPQRTYTGEKDIFLMGGAIYGEEKTIPYLPGTKVEVDNIANITKAKNYKVTKVTGKDANEGLMKEFAKSHYIIHLATHGFFIPDVEGVENEKLFGVDMEKAKQNPMLRSGLMFANAEKALKNEKTSPELRQDNNGILTANELSMQNLESTEILLMSACETGLGDVKAGEGVYGLQRAVKLAGVKTLIMSLWTVSDAATQRLMTLFYQNFTVSNNKVDAFNKAILQLKTEFKEPYYWGAFMLIGE